MQSPPAGRTCIFWRRQNVSLRFRKTAVLWSRRNQIWLVPPAIGASFFSICIATMGYRRLLLGLAALSWAGAEAKNVEERKIQVMNER